MGALNKSERQTVNLVREAIAAKILRPTRKQVIDLAGRPQTVPAYEPIERGQ
jgi:hypothetical protein